MDVGDAHDKCGKRPWVYTPRTLTVLVHPHLSNCDDIQG